MTIVLRTATEPLSLVEPLRRQLQELDPEVSMFDVRSMQQRLDDSLWLRRCYSLLFAAFAGAALVLAVGGVYGIVSFTVGQRTNEIGLRIALGAQRSQVLRQVLRQGLVWIGLGLLLGVVGALAASSVLKAMPFGISTIDLATYAAGSAIVVSVSVVATFLPARRAAGVDPAVALRQE